MPKIQKAAESLSKAEFNEFVQKEFSPLKGEVTNIRMDVNSLKEDFSEFKTILRKMANNIDWLMGKFQVLSDEKEITDSRLEALEEIHPKHQHAPA